MKKQFTCRAGAIVAAIMLGGCLPAGAAFADDAIDFSSMGIPDALQSGLHGDYLTSDSSDISTLQGNTGFPSALDLRHYNGKITYDSEKGKSVITDGINYVTPVKLQNPFGSCWAFSIISSAETSLLTSLDKADDGLMNGTVNYENAAAGEAGKVAYNASDLSERALAYSTFTYPKSDGNYSTQAGEGNYLVSGTMGDGASILNNGGMPFTGVSTFSCVIGPTPEYIAPYMSDEGWVEVPTPEFDLSTFTLKKQYFTNLTEAIKFWETTWTDDAIKKFNEENHTNYTKAALKPARSSKGTWAIDGDKVYGTVAELTESKILETTKGDGLTNDEITAMKEELCDGRAISIAYCSDQSLPGQTITGSSYINTTNWAQYTYEKKQVNHGVTIVGYDDNYAASNFTHTIYNADGSPNEEETNKTTPAGNGAWIVKNSWGSSDAKSILNQNNWGIDGSGYFYLSYYDKNISSMESFEFDTSQEAQTRTSFETEQYDLSKGSEADTQSFDTLTQMCNVFDGPEKGENPVAIRDLGCLTGAANDTVTFDIYVMNDSEDAATVIANGNPTMTVSQLFDDAGFHRVHLDNPVVSSSGQKIAIVQTTKRINGKYEVTCIRGFNESFVEAFNAANTVAGVNPIISAMFTHKLNSYTYTVVNEGESLINVGGTWKDWTTERSSYGITDTVSLVKEVQADGDSALKKAEDYEKVPGQEAVAAFYKAYGTQLKAFTCSNAFTYDNFSIKIYGDEVTEPEDQTATVYRLYNSETSEHLWTTDANEYDTLMSCGWTQEGAAWKSPTSGVGIYRLYNSELGTHHYTSDQNEIDVLVNNYGWEVDNGDKPLFYSADSASSDVTAVYRLYNDDLAQHMLTMDTQEYDTLPSYGWEQEGIALYALK